MATQIKKGYMRGCRGILLTGLNADGSMPDEPEQYWIDTAQEASIETEIVEGETSDLRGGDRLLVRVEESDVIVGVNVDFTNARFDARVVQMLMGGKLITEGSGDDEEIIGWEAPTVVEQSVKHPVQAEVYVQSFNGEGGREAYLKYIFPYAIGVLSSVEHSDQEWGTPEFSLKARENPSTGAAAYSKRFVADLPTVKYDIDVDITGGTATVTLNPVSPVPSGSTVTVTLSAIETGKELDTIVAMDSDGTQITLTETLPGEAWTFTMPRSAVTIAIALKLSE
jgi:hypothetical protein